MNPLRTSELRNYLDFNLFGERSIKLRLLPVPVPSKNVVKIRAKTNNYLKISFNYQMQLLSLRCCLDWKIVLLKNLGNPVWK